MGTQNRDDMLVVAGGAGGTRGESLSDFGGGGGSGYIDGSAVETLEFTQGGADLGFSSNSDGRVRLFYEVEPSAPSNLQVTNTTSNSVSLSWNDNTSGGSDGFRIYRSTSSGVTTGDTQVGDVSPTSFTDSGLQTGQTYYYLVTSYTSVGESSVSNEVSGQTSFPITIDGEQVTGITIDGENVTGINIDGSSLF